MVCFADKATLVVVDPETPAVDFDVGAAVVVVVVVFAVVAFAEAEIAAEASDSAILIAVGLETRELLEELEIPFYS